MKRTIATSFLFLLPINLFFMDGDIFHANICTLCLGLSVANHSHSFYTHHDLLRKNGIRLLDQLVQCINLVYSLYVGLTTFNCYVYASINFWVISFIYLRYLLFTETEKYSPLQKTLHSVWHCICIFSMTHYKYACQI